MVPVRVQRFSPQISFIPSHICFSIWSGIIPFRGVRELDKHVFRAKTGCKSERKGGIRGNITWCVMFIRRHIMAPTNTTFASILVEFLHSGVSSRLKNLRFVKNVFEINWIKNPYRHKWGYGAAHKWISTEDNTFAEIPKIMDWRKKSSDD